eukprot:Transcript_10425.p1 GENE.Transcript_10425~~Transcript_10425.p1  ORF type:complete len:423 (+),score=75.82 Transcript_10425:147-1271(+)
MLGRALQSSGASDLLVGSKAAPSQPGGLSATGMRSQLDASLGAIGVERLAEYYLHQPDTEAALLESLREAHAMVSEGKVGAVGMSNYHASEVARAFELCAEHGLTKPSVYQGLYNPLNRAVEEELLPVLRAHGCSFVAFNPLAAGLLTGAHKRDGEVPAGRFKDNPNYLPRFYTSPNFDALQAISAACDAAGLSVLDAAFCWLLRHSALGPEDGLLIGASSLAQLEYADSSSLQPDHSRAIAAWLCCSAAHAFGSTPLGPAPTSPRARRPRPPSCPRPCARLSTARGRRRGRAPSATGAPTLPTCPAVTPSTPAPATRRTGPSERRGREAVSHASTVRAVVRDGTGRRAGAVGRDDGFGAAACHISCHGIQLSS